MQQYTQNWNDRYINDDTPWQDGTPCPVMMHLFADFIPKGQSILEVGCGAGIDGRWLISRGYRYTGIDIADEAVMRAQKYSSGGQFASCDIFAYKSDCTFDVIYDKGVLHTFSDEASQREYIDKIRALLSPSGHYILIAGSADNDDAREAKERRYPRISAQSMIALLEPYFQLHHLARCVYGQTQGINDFFGWASVWQLRV